MRPALALLRLATLASLLALVLAGCSRRERLNPFDPQNPDTHGRPSGFAALAGNNVVTLQWQRATASGLLGYRLDRRVTGDSAWTVIGDLIPSHATSFGDFGVQNGVDHHYRLYFVFAAGPAVLPAEDSAMPGPLRPWVTDFDGPTLLRLTPDGRHAAFADHFFESPSHVAVDPATGVVWTCDYYGSRVVVHASGTQPPRVIGGIPEPLAVAVDRVDGTAWISDGRNDRILHLRDDGTLARTQIASALHDPFALAVDPRDRALWVCENAGNKLRRFEAEGLPQWGVDVPRPWRVAIDSLTGAAWVTSPNEGQVRIVTAAGVVFDTFSGFRGPIGIAVDWRRGRIWVAEAAADRVVALRRDGTEEFRVGGLGEAREIAVDLRTGEAWVTAPGDGAVARISPAGVLLRKLGGFEFPYGIALDPGVR